MELKNKVAIVTGASRGIGRQIALELTRRGVKVAIAARTVEAKQKLPGSLGETMAAIEKEGGTAIAVQTDIRNPAELERLVQKTIEAYGRLDILINNAADTKGAAAPIESYPRDIWLAQFDANVHAPFTLMALCVPHLKAQGGGVIINMTSGAGDLMAVSLTPADATKSPVRLGTLLGYQTTKAALNRLSNSVAPDLVADNIAVVCVDPGYTRTELVDKLGEKGLADPNMAHPMAVPVKTVLDVLTADNPLAVTGQILRAAPYPGQARASGA